MSVKAWTISGEYMESCNCDYLCPCIYTNPQGEATFDHCTPLLVFRIDLGQCSGVGGDVDLAGLKFALVIRSGKVMSDGDWIFANVVDDSADDAQRAALAGIVSGELGGVPGMIRDNLVSDYRGLQFKPIDFIMDGLARSVDIPGVLSYEIEGVASRNGNGQPFYIDNTAHPANTRLALARSKSTRIQAFDLDLDMQGKGNNGHFAAFSWAG